MLDLIKPQVSLREKKKSRFTFFLSFNNSVYVWQFCASNDFRLKMDSFAFYLIAFR